MSDDHSDQQRPSPWSPLGWLDDARTALGFFTRLPVPGEPGTLSEAARAFPMAGLVVGALGALVYVIAMESGLSGLLAALLGLATMVLVTGGLHEDGLADFCDMLGTRGDIEARLAVMRDSRIGCYGVLGLGFSVAIKAAAIVDLGTPDLVAAALVSAHIASRGVLPLVMRSFSLARTDGLGVSAGRPTSNGARLSLGLALLLMALAIGPGAAIVAMIAALVAAFLVAEAGRRLIGGYTGDVLGAAQQLAELAVLINLVAMS